MPNTSPTFYALHVGVVHVDETHYNYTLRSLPCCETDTLAMKEFAKILGFEEKNIKVLLNETATVSNFKKELLSLKESMKGGDFLLITYSGHGGRMTYLDPDTDDDDKAAETYETWCLYDRQMLDIELPEIWAAFEEGVKIVLVMDSCHSGGAARELMIGDDLDKRWWISKSMDSQTMEKFFKGSANEEAIKQLYLGLQDKYANRPTSIKADFLHLAACKADQVALAGPFMSKYTRIFLNNFSEKPFSNYKAFYDEIEQVHQSIRERTGENQSPMFNDDLFGAPSNYFLESIPFVKDNKQLNEEQRAKIGALTKWVKGKDVVEETNTGLLIDSSELGDKSIVEKEEWISLLTEEKKSLAKETSSLYWQPSSKQHKNKAKAWDLAYEKYFELEKKGSPVFIEPTFCEEIRDGKAFGMMSKNANTFLQRWPSPNQDEFSWYLGERFSQLEKARTYVQKYLEVSKQKETARIAHIDTGIRYEHIAFKNTKINRKLAKSFLPGEKTNPAIDVLARERNKGKIVNWEAVQRIAEQDFHGTATLAILSGGLIPKDQSYGNFEGEIGGIPFAEIIPLRISETVALTGLMFNVKEFAQALKYAISDKCQCNVVSMSMAGSPSRAWAKVVNEAYDAGCIVVSAAGNSWRRNDASFQWRRPIRSALRSIGSLGQSLLPKKLMYPARFARVIAATGVTYNQQPYVFDSNTQYQKTAGGEFMQGNYGPQWAMDYAIAGYTPNIPWAELKEDNSSVFLRSGGGTSSATPQIAAAAALYITRHRNQMQRDYGDPNWRWAEATRKALFDSADASYPNARKYLGMGVIKAYDALINHPPPPKNKLKRNEKKARIISGFGAFLKQTFGKNADPDEDNRPMTALEEMIELEAIQIIHRDPELMQYAAVLEDHDQILTKDDIKSIFEKVKKSDFASEYLKKFEIA